MTTLTRRKSKLTLQQLLDAARELPPADQRHLRDELAKMVGLQLVRPTGNPTAIRRGKRLAKAVRAELAKTTTGSFDKYLQRIA